MKIYLSSKGIKTGIDNSKIINRAIELAKDRDTLYFPAGYFQIWEPVVQKNKLLFWECPNEGASIVPATGKSGVIISGGLPGTVMKNISIHNAFGGWGENGPRVQDRDMGHVGLTCWSVVHLEAVSVIGFYGRGFEFSGMVEKGLDSSGSTMMRCHASHNHTGIYVQGPDNNAITFQSNDIRDNYGVGAHDQSFLGNNWISNMFHNNQGGNMLSALSNPGHHARWIANYSENQPTPDRFYGSAVVIPGTQGPYIELYDNAVAHVGAEIWTAKDHGELWWENE